MRTGSVRIQCARSERRGEGGGPPSPGASPRGSRRPGVAPPGGREARGSRGPGVASRGTSPGAASGGASGGASGSEGEPREDLTVRYGWTRSSPRPWMPGPPGPTQPAPQNREQRRNQPPGGAGNSAIFCLQGRRERRSLVPSGALRTAQPSTFRARGTTQSFALRGAENGAAFCLQGRGERRSLLGARGTAHPGPGGPAPRNRPPTQGNAKPQRSATRGHPIPPTPSSPRPPPPGSHPSPDTAAAR